MVMFEVWAEVRAGMERWAMAVVWAAVRAEAEVGGMVVVKAGSEAGATLAMVAESSGLVSLV